MAQETKTVKQWFNENLSPSDAEKAIKYTPEDVLDSSSDIDEDEPTGNPLWEAFNWAKTEEGHDYWCRLAEEIG